MRRKVLWLFFVPLLFLTGCTEGRDGADSAAPVDSGSIIQAESTADTDNAENTRNAEKIAPAENPTAADDPDKEEENVGSEMKETVLKMTINGHAVTVEWEDNESVDALAELATDPVTVQMSMYGGFEQVGSLGTSLPRNDVQTTTEAGDIVLYSGNQIVVFYGSNSWAYTRLGKITDQTKEEMAELLGNGDVTLGLSVE